MNLWMIFFFLILSLNASAVTILHIGDSHSAGPFGELLVKKYVNDSNFVSYASPGANIGNYLSGDFGKKTVYEYKFGNKKTVYEYKNNKKIGGVPNFPNLIKKTNPQIVSVALGSNDIGNITEKKVQDLINSLPSQSKCVWSLAPNMPLTKNYALKKSLPKTNELITRIAGKRCKIINPLNGKTFKSSDDLHFSSNNPEVPKWTEAVYSQIESFKKELATSNSTRNPSMPSGGLK